MTTNILGDGYRLIIGSEWNYSPYVYPLLSQLLEKFILVGLPASEAQIALLIPTAGHELGHAIWRDSSIHLYRTFNSMVERNIIDEYKIRWSSVNAASIDTDLEARAVWTTSYKYASRQLEEAFCDCVGVWLFGESYLHSFRFLLAPDSASRPSDNYPPNRRRAEYAVKAASQYGDSVDTLYPDVFRVPDATTDLRVEIADAVTDALVPKIFSEVSSFLSGKPLSRPTDDNTKKNANGRCGRLVHLTTTSRLLMFSMPHGTFEGLSRIGRYQVSTMKEK
jgi:hypothetical protein